MAGSCLVLRAEEFHQAAPEPVFVGFDHCVEGLVGLLAEFADVLYSIRKCFDGLVPAVTFYFAKFFQDWDHEVQFAFFPFFHDLSCYFPDVFFCREEFFPFAGYDDFLDQTPVYQFAEVHVGVAAADVQLLHDFVGAQVVGAYEEQGVYLCHGPVDAPVGAESSPVSDELSFCFCQLHVLILGC